MSEVENTCDVFDLHTRKNANSQGNLHKKGKQEQYGKIISDNIENSILWKTVTQTIR